MIKITEDKHFKFWIMSILIGILVSTLVYFINSGFELNDEGFYFLGYSNSQSIFFSFSGFHYLVRLIPFSDDIIINRLYRIFFHLLSAILLSNALKVHFKMSINKFELFFWIFLGNLYSYVYSPASLSYNTLNLFFIQLGLSLYLFYLNATHYRNKLITLFLFSVSLLVFIKATTGVLFFSILSIDYFLRVNELKRIKLAKIFLAGLIVSILVLLLFYLSSGSRLLSILEMILQKQGPFYIKQAGSNFQLMQLLWNPLYQSKFQLVFVFGYLLIYLISKKNNKKLRGLNGLELLSYVLLTLLVFYYYLNHYACGPGVEIFTVLILVLLIVIIYERKISKIVDLKMFFVILLLPIIGFFGSDVAPFEGMNHYAVFFVFLIVFLMGIVNLKYSIIYSVFITLFILVRFINYPFENPPLYSMKKEIVVGKGLVNLIVNDSVFSTYQNFQVVNKILKPKLNTVFLNVFPGIIYLNNKNNYGSLYYNNLDGLIRYIELLYFLKPVGNIQYVIGKNNLKAEASTKIEEYISYCSKFGKIDTTFNNDNFTVLNYR